MSASGPFIGPKGGKWADPEHTIPWRPSVNVKPGEKMQMHGKDHHAEVARVEDGKAHVVQVFPDGHRSSAVKMPVESVQGFHDDLNGIVRGPANAPHPAIQDVLDEKAEFLGKGDDGMAFKAGDKVVKVSTGVPFQPMNQGHLTPKAAANRLVHQANVSEHLRKLGVPGLLPIETHRHGDKSFQVRDHVEIPRKLTKEQLDDAKETLLAMHKHGYSLNDDVQVGVKDGKGVMYDTGKASPMKNPSDHSYRSEREDDIGRLRELYKQHGHKLQIKDPAVAAEKKAALDHAMKGDDRAAVKWALKDYQQSLEHGDPDVWLADEKFFEWDAEKKKAMTPEKQAEIETAQKEKQTKREQDQKAEFRRQDDVAKKSVSRLNELFDMKGADLTYANAKEARDTIKALKGELSSSLPWDADESELADMASAVEKRWQKKLESHEFKKGMTMQKAGGPFVGPKGGMWADAKHTVHWVASQAHLTPGTPEHGEAKARFQSELRAASAVQDLAKTKTGQHGSTLKQLAGRMFDQKPYDDLAEKHPKQIAAGLRHAAGVVRVGSISEHNEHNADVAQHMETSASEIEAMSTPKKKTDTKKTEMRAGERIPNALMSAFQTDVLDPVAIEEEEPEETARNSIIRSAISWSHLIVPADAESATKLKSALTGMAGHFSELADSAPEASERKLYSDASDQCSDLIGKIDKRTQAASKVKAAPVAKVKAAPVIPPEPSPNAVIGHAVRHNMSVPGAYTIHPVTAAMRDDKNASWRHHGLHPTHAAAEAAAQETVARFRKGGSPIGMAFFAMMKAMQNAD